MKRIVVAAVIARAALALADVTVVENVMPAWTDRCASRLERARQEMAHADESFARAKIKTEQSAVLLSVEKGSSIRTVRVVVTNPESPERNNWKPPRDQWVHLPIIDKAYSTLKLNLFRWSVNLEGSITAYRGDSSLRAPPVPAWLKRFVEVFQPAVEDCLSQPK